MKKVSDEEVEEYCTVLGNLTAVRLLREKARSLEGNAGRLRALSSEAELEARARELCAVELRHLADTLSAQTVTALFKMMHKDRTEH